MRNTEGGFFPSVVLLFVFSGATCLNSSPPPPPLSPPAVRTRLLRLRSLWDEIRQRAEEREEKLNDVLDLAGKFWADVAALLSTLRDSQDIVKELEDPGVDPSLIKQQIEAAEVRRARGDGRHLLGWFGVFLTLHPLSTRPSRPRQTA